MSQIKISVIIPTCHRNDALAECLERLAPGAQTLAADEYEVIVTDDGRATTAEQMIRERHPWVLWLAGPRKGPASNRNNGARHAQGEWLAFTDDDCLPSATWLSAFSSAITPGAYVYEGKTTCEAGIHSPLEHAPINITGGYLWSCNMMIYKTTFEEVGGFDENFPSAHMEDVDLRQRLTQSSYMFLFIPHALVDHPPRRLPWGNILGASAESSVLFSYKEGSIQHMRRRLLYTIVATRLNAIRNHQIGRDSFLAMVSLVVEVWHVSLKLGAWQRKYRARFHACRNHTQ